MMKYCPIQNKIIAKTNSYSINSREMQCLQHFYKKSPVVSCYWFKFETNIKITFLPQ